MMSQCQVIGRPRVKSWKDYRQGCLDTYAGGHHNDGHLEAFQHGMETVFNLLEDEFPTAELCKAAPELLEALTALLDGSDEEEWSTDNYGDTIPMCKWEKARAAISKAKGETL